MDSDWIHSEENPGYNSKTIQHGSCTIIILRPALSPEESKKREREVCASLEHSLRPYFKRKEVKA